MTNYNVKQVAINTLPRKREKKIEVPQKCFSDSLSKLKVIGQKHHKLIAPVGCFRDNRLVGYGIMFRMKELYSLQLIT